MSAISKEMRPHYQISTIPVDIGSSPVQLPENQENTAWKVAKYASLGLIPLLFAFGKAIKESSLLIYHSLFDPKKLSIEHEKLLFREGSDELITYTNLLNMQQLSPASLRVLKGLLSKDCCLLETITSAEISSSLSNNRVVIIPLIIKGGWFIRGIYSRDHITTLIIDRNKKSIVYIDPKGKTLADYKSDKVRSSNNNYSTIESIYQEVIRSVSTISPKTPWTLTQRTSQYQYDGYNCGVHFLHNVYRYGLDKVIPPSLTKVSEIVQFRRYFINLILHISSRDPEQFQSFDSSASIIAYEDDE
jgi:hypothetical protein